MSTLTGFLQDLLLQGVELSIEDGKLVVEAREGMLRPETVAKLRLHKEEILRLLPECRFEAPLSAEQEGLWFIYKTDPDSPVYNSAMALRIESEGDLVPALRRALQKLINRHALLRTSYTTVNGIPRQVVHGYRAVDLVEINAAHMSLEEVRSAAAAASRRPFDLEAEGAFRAYLFRRGPRESILLLSLHHIAVDGWSFRLLIDELIQLWRANGRPVRLPPVKRTYQQYVAWQRDLLASRGEELRRGWMEELKGAPLVLNLPIDRARPPAQTFRGATVRRTLTAALTDGLHKLARSQSTTRSTLLLAAYQALLQRYSGQEDICVGLSVSRRDREELASTFGYMVNVLVVRAELPAAGPTDFLSLVQQTHQRVLAAMSRQDYPFPWLVKDLLTHRDPDRAPVVQVAFLHQQAQSSVEAASGLLKGTPLEVEGARFESFPLHQEISETELLLEVDDRQGSLEIGLRYNADLFDAGTIERMAGHLETLLGEIVSDPGRPVAQMPMLTAAEREQLLVAWNRTRAPFSSEACIHQLFEAQVDRTPDAHAVVDLCGDAAHGRGAALTFRELDRRANQVAHALLRRGVGPETLVGLHLERGADLIVGLLGVLKAGGAAVVLDPDHPRRRLAFLLEDTGAPVLLSRASLLGSLPETRARVVDFDRELEGEPTHRPESGVRPENLAYVLYTSGTTGQPNGALIEHRGLVNSIEAHIRILETGPGARLAHVLSFNFDAAIAHLFDTICAGATLYLAPRDSDFLRRGFVELMEREAISHTALVPSMLAVLPDAELPSLRTLVVGGEKCSAELVARWGRGRRLINVYGPTEVSILATAARCVPDGNPPPIGRPIANIKAYVLDRWGQLAAPGVVGELCLGGVGVARGYLNRPELTARKFILTQTQNPFGEGRLYRTGDLVRYRLADDRPPELEFIGRVENDSQVKIRGYRVELAEVESALRASPQVRDAVVTVQEAGERAALVAYVTPARRERSQAWESERIASWDKLNAKIVDEAPPEGELTLDIKGWKSSYTGEDIPPEEMRVWAESTVARILDLAPREVLEIGCGTGMLLARVAPRVLRYRGTDLSRHALEHVELMKAKLGGLENVHVSQQPAHDFTGLTGDRFDTVILNSVIQYFPSADYLLGVIEGLLGLMPEAGSIFLGDIRNLALLPAFHASVERFRAGAMLSRRELSARVQRALVSENELVVHPHFFTALRARFPQIADVEIAPKRGGYKNELSSFRYDVTLRIGAKRAAPAPGPSAWRDVGVEGLTPDEIRAWIARSAPGSTLGLRGIPNARLHKENALLRWLSAEEEEDRRPWQPPPLDPRAWEPEALYALSSELPCQVSLSWAAGRADGSLDAIVTTGDRPSAPHFPLDEAAAPASWADLTNDPLLSIAYRELSANLRDELGEALPPHLVPSAIVVVPALPLTLNGKVDLRALPLLAATNRASEQTAPRSDVERKLAAVWREVLGLDDIGVHDNFFHVGGHSLLAVQVLSRLPSALRVELPMRALFDMPTIEALARHIEATQGNHADATSRQELRATPHAGTLPVSPAQRRLWFLSQLEGANVAYNMPLIADLRGPLDTGAFSRAIEELVRRHESLRTTFRLEAEGPVQVIHPPAPLEIPVIDVSGVEQAELERQLDREAHGAFDMERGPLLRARLFRVSPGHHVLCLIIHHIIGDGWSMGVFGRELAALYSAFTRGQPSPLPELPLQYADWSRWQEARFAGSEGERLLAYWRRKLAGLEPLRLPTDRPRPAVESFRGGHHVFHVDRELTGALQALSREEGVTIYITLLAAFDVLLARYSGQDDIAVSSGAANRKHPALEGLIGFFVNTLVVRSDLSDNPTFRALLQRVKTSVLEASEHEDLPFERVVEELRPERTASHNPLAQVALTLQNFADTTLSLPGLEVSPWRLRFRTSKFDLTWLITEVDARLEVMIEYNADLFDLRTASRMGAHFEALLGDIARDRGRPIGELSLLGGDERRRLLVEYNRTEAPFSSEACIHQLFEAHADRDPDAIALVDRCGGAEGAGAGDQGAALTYGELDRRANQVAHHLIRLGVGPETLVGLHLPRGADLIVGLLGVLKAGGAFVVLDPEHPRRRLSFLLEDTGMSVLLSRASLRAELPETRARVIDFDRGFEGEPVGRPESRVGPENLAYVLYTSGTTGQPNGALIEHRGLVNCIESTARMLEVGPGARLVHVLSFNFDGALLKLFWMLCEGGAVYLAPRDGDFLGQGFIELVEREAITHTLLPPTMLAALPNAAALPSLLTLVAGGESCSAEIVTRWSRGRRFFNMYGPTEVSIVATSARCIADDRAPPIGRPIPNLQVYVVDRWGQLAPTGVPGELYLGGVGLARGYLNRPELTARKFIDNPFADGRLYRTGDVVRYRVIDDDRPPALEFIGRLDNQVKIRGYRIELSEVESALRASPRVRDAVATVHEGADGEGGPRRIVAYVTPAKPERPEGSGLAQVASWRAIYDQLADEDPGERELTLDIRGWKSSYTGEDIPAEEMRTWAESTVARILDLAPREVLEIGCGTGMLLARVAPRVRRYRGTDFSRYAIEHVKALQEKLGGLDNVVVSQQPAHDLTGLTLTGERFDTVVMNSVVQYFPSADYLLHVIEGLLGLMPETGAIFIGDVRNLALLPTYHASVERFRAGGSLPRRELSARVQRAMIDENELVLHPHFFTALRARFPQIVDVEITPKRGGYKNELSAFRYDVTLRIGAAPPAPAPGSIAWRDVGAEGLTPDDLRAWIAGSAPGTTLGLRGIPNAQLQAENALMRWLSGDEEDNREPRRPLSPDLRVWDPEALYALSAELPCQITLSWAAGRADGSLDAVVTTGAAAQAPRFPLDKAAAPASWADLANDPLLSIAYRELSANLRSELGETLPQHLVPSAIVVLPALPLTLNGKVDLRALPRMAAGNTASEQTAPRSDVERKLAEVWRGVLGLDNVGVHDDFFDLGGHSLLAMTMLARVEEVFGRRIPVSALFQAPTLEALARRISGPAVDSLLNPIQPAGNRPPVFWVTGAGIHIAHLLHLGKRLGADQPFYGIQPLDLEAEMPNFDRMEALAARLADAIQKVQPAGPYLLSGHSGGAIIALPIAFELEARGHETTLVIVDMHAPRPAPPVKEGEFYLLSYVQRMQTFLGDRLDLNIEALKQLPEEDAWQHVADHFQRMHFLPPGPGVELLRRLVRPDPKLQRLLMDYRPESPYQGRLVVLKAGEANEDGSQLPTDGWQEICARPVANFTVPGNHVTMVLDPHVDVVVEHLRRLVDEGQASTSTGTQAPGVW
jgi:amino acid adenylation domain-containing protein